jgi:hypothetical protein
VTTIIWPVDGADDAGDVVGGGVVGRGACVVGAGVGGEVAAAVTRVVVERGAPLVVGAGFVVVVGRLVVVARGAVVVDAGGAVVVGAERDELLPHAPRTVTASIAVAIRTHRTSVAYER